MRLLARADHRGVGDRQRSTCTISMLVTREHVGIYPQRHVGIGVPELARYEHHIQARADQHRRVAVAQRVEGEPTGAPHARLLHRSPERGADSAVVTPTTLSRGEHTRNAQMCYGVPDVCETGRASWTP